MLQYLYKCQNMRSDDIYCSPIFTYLYLQSISVDSDVIYKLWAFCVNTKKSAMSNQKDPSGLYIYRSSISWTALIFISGSSALALQYISTLPVLVCCLSISCETLHELQNIMLWLVFLLFVKVIGAFPTEQFFSTSEYAASLELRPIKLGKINFLHTTDTHGWLGSHLLQRDFNADWGDQIGRAHV